MPFPCSRMYIDGRWTDGSGRQGLAVINPATQELLAEVPEGGVQDARNAIAAARRAFDSRREVFGPVSVIIPFDDDEHGIRLANDSDYGLGGGVWSADPVRAYGVARRMRTGNVIINGGGGGGLNPDAPFGGYKQSGLGREWGATGLEEFLQTKAITWPAGVPG